MKPGHLAEAQKLSASMDWPHRIEDWAMVLDLGHGLVALDDGDVFGTIMWWPYDESHATLGLIIVSPDRQGRGHGRQLMEAALAEIGPRAIFLNATREGLPLYTKTGFRKVGVVCQHQGVPTRDGSDEVLDGTCIRPLNEDHVADVIGLDNRATGWQRERLLRRILADGEGMISGKGDRIDGYALCRRFGFGHVIGPVVARDDQIARALIGAWIARCGEGFVRVDSPPVNGLSDWLTSQGLLKHDSVVTMARGVAPDNTPAAPHVFALASQALG